MSKRSKVKKEKNLFNKIIYMVLVIALLGCIFLLLLNAKYRSGLYEQEVERVAVGESEYTVEEWESTEEDTETESETEEPQTEAPATEPVTAAATNYNASILVLNGTRRPGVAGFWKERIENMGYANIMTATYTGSVSSETVIYASSTELGEPLKAEFPEGTVQVGSITEGIEPNSGETLPDKFDIYVVVGNNDADTTSQTETQQTETQQTETETSAPAGGANPSPSPSASPSSSANSTVTGV